VVFDGFAVGTLEYLLDDFVLVDEVEDVRRVDEDADRAGDDDRQEDVQLEAVDHRRHVHPVVEHLQSTCTRNVATA